jgi:tetratricopeptide (TPR) repeat protein
MGPLIEQIFLSYADEDAVTARRVYLDLARFKKVDVWGYKESRRFGVNFKQEFEEQIKASKYFCLLDSPNSRESSWIARECEVATESKVTRVVCSLMEWTETAKWRQRELFKDQNFVTAIDLTDYDAGIRQLCKCLQITYFPWSAFPRDQDFNKEVWDSGLDEDRSQELVDLYRNFREHFADPEFAEALLRVVIKKCQFYCAKNVISPILALGVMQADAGRHLDAMTTFTDLAVTHERDPRAWAALGGSHFYLGHYDRSLQALYHSRELVLAHYKEESAQHIVEVVHNIANVLILLGRYNDAGTEINGLSTEEQAHPFIRALRGRLLMHEGQYSHALWHLKEAYEAGVDVSPSLVIGLA